MGELRVNGLAALAVFCVAAGFPMLYGQRQVGVAAVCGAVLLLAATATAVILIHEVLTDSG